MILPLLHVCPWTSLNSDKTTVRNGLLFLYFIILTALQKSKTCLIVRLWKLRKFRLSRGTGTGPLQTISIQQTTAKRQHSPHTGIVWGRGSVIIIRRKSVCRPCKHWQRWRMHRSLVTHTRVDRSLVLRRRVCEDTFPHASLKCQTIVPYLALLKDRVLQHKQTNKQTQHVQNQSADPRIWRTNELKWKMTKQIL